MKEDLKQSGGEASPSLACSQVAFDHDGLYSLREQHGEGNVDGGEDFCDPWWDSESSCWVVACRYADCGLRQYCDGWEYALDGKRWETAAEAYQHRNDKFHAANATAMASPPETPTNSENESN